MKIILQNSFKTFQELSIISSHAIHCVKTATVSWRVAQHIAMLIHYTRCKFHENRIHACKWNIFMRMTTGSEIILISEQYFGTRNSNSKHGKSIAHYIGQNIVKINNRSICISYRCGIACFANNCHEWLRPDLKKIALVLATIMELRKLTRFSRISDRIPSRHVKIQRKSRTNPTRFQKAAHVAF